jgi:uncharacterized protein
MKTRILTRRQVLTGVGAIPLGLGGGGAYARWIEPGSDIHVAHYQPRPLNWPVGQKLKIAALADLHCGSVHMSLERIAEIVARTNALKPDITLLLGDYVCREKNNVHAVSPSEWASALAGLKAPLGVHAILGNHEYWDDPAIQRSRQGAPYALRALEAAGIPVMTNTAIRLDAGTGPFWLAGVDDQLCFMTGRNRFIGRDDLPGTLAQVTDSAPVILMAHEPDLFVDVPSRVSLTLSGHTHGGQVRFFGWAPYVPSNYGGRFQHGHVVEDERHLIVSAGLGTSGPPMRFGVPPEIVVVEMGTQTPMI